LEDEILNYITQKIISRYKLDEQGAYTIACEIFYKHPKYKDLIAKELPFNKILKSKILKEIITNSKTKAYYSLRSYKNNKESLVELVHLLETINHHEEIQPIINELVLNHISTKERIKENNTFYKNLDKIICETQSIIDIGCGLNPLLFPFIKYTSNLKNYLAIDKDLQSITALHAFKEATNNHNLNSTKFNLDEGWETLKIEYEFDIAFMMKLVPVIKRSSKIAYENLLKTPADIWVITGSKTSMTKYKSIERRELNIINRFIDEAGKKIIDQFSLEEEFCIIVE